MTHLGKFSHKFGTAIKNNSLWKWVTSTQSFLGDICNFCIRFIRCLCHLEPACGRIDHCKAPQFVFDRGTKFMAEFAKMCHNDYVLKRKPITTRNPQSNAIIERIHQTIGNIIRTFDVSNIVNNDPGSGILAGTMFSVRATYHTTIKAS